jgi:hypothetical protein
MGTAWITLAGRAEISASAAKRSDLVVGASLIEVASPAVAGPLVPSPLRMRLRVGEFALSGFQHAGTLLVHTLVGPDVLAAVVVALGQDRRWPPRR